MNTGLKNACSLLAGQISIPKIRSNDDKLRHIDKLIERISRLLDQRPADLVVLPELCTIEYSRDSFDRLSELAENLDGHSVERFRMLAIKYGVAIVFGMPRRDGEKYFISQVLIGAQGELLGNYDKLHICQYGASMEKEFFCRGENLSVFSLAGFRFAPIICYDIRIPELSRTLTLEHEVDCILHCGAYYRDESFASWHSFATTRAMENQLYLLSLNRAGKHYGDSVFCLPWMDENQPSVRFANHDEDFRYLNIERSNIDAARDQYSFLKDRLNDYSGLPH
jgi:predicted amidohydrolase